MFVSREYVESRIGKLSIIDARMLMSILVTIEEFAQKAGHIPVPSPCLLRDME
jgi:hypothetical protein